MLKLIKELRRREVFRTTGLYIGGAWIVLQVAELVLPVYDAPEWVMKALISVAIVGLPIAITLAWLYDLKPSGIILDTGAVDSEEGAPISSGRKADFVVIAVLLVALAGSMFGNFAPRDPVILEELDPVTILIADFENTTGDTVFDGALEQALTIAIEESPFITAFNRASARRVLAKIDEASTLNPAGARLVSAREGISVVVSGQLTEDNGKYNVAIASVNVASGEELASFQEQADSKSEVLAVIGELARSLREDLGDANAEIKVNIEETFTTVSLEAMHDYVNAQRLARDGNDEEALALYQSAVAKDAGFGRAWSGLAVSADKLGRTDISAEAWPKVLALLENMTERERYRTAGIYYSEVAHNSQKAIENYSLLVEKFPADDAGYNNLAVAYFMSLQFDKALEAGRKVVDIYPTRPMYHANYSLYAMYASDFEAALVEAAKTLELNPNYHKAYLPYAVAALVNGDTDAARAAYEKMATTGTRGVSLANIGLADMLLLSGDAVGADALLLEGMKADEIAANKRALATKTMMRAYASLQQGKDITQISSQIAESLALSSSVSTLVPAALMHVTLGKEQEAADIANALGNKLDLQQRAYAMLINARLMQAKGQHIAAVETLQEAVSMADLWLIRLNLGKAYVDAGLYTEAVLEFTNCKERLGEAYSLFLDDTPTLRYAADLDDHLERARNSMTAQP